MITREPAPRKGFRWSGAATAGSTKVMDGSRTLRYKVDSMQRGQVYQQNHAWWVRFYRDEIVDGKPVRRRVCQRVADVCDDYRTKTDVWPIADAILAPVNKGGAAEGGLTVEAFATKYFLPYVKAKKKASTFKFYKDAIANHVTDRVGHIRLRDFSARHAQEVLDAASGLSHSSVLRVKSAMSAVFSYAVRLGFIIGANPVREAKAEGRRSEFEAQEYSLQEIEDILKSLEEPARTICAVAAFAGLREGEIRGLKREDYDPEAGLLHVRRAIWRVHVADTKTIASRSVVPVIPALKKLLDAHIQRDGNGAWLFTGAKKGFSLNLDNLVARNIRPALGERWKGWHSFRRALGTNLFALGVPPEVVQTILRHSDASVTRKHYILIKSRTEGRAAMSRLSRALGQGMGKSRKRKSRKNPRKH